MHPINLRARPWARFGIRLAGGRTWVMDFRSENNFLPDLEAIPNHNFKREIG